MPKLYYTSTSCGAASFIAAHASGLGLACEEVNLGEHKTASGADFYAINPKGNGVLRRAARGAAAAGSARGGARLAPAWR
jgi:hypothetical protein